MYMYSVIIHYFYYALTHKIIKSLIDQLIYSYLIFVKVDYLVKLTFIAKLEILYFNKQLFITIFTSYIYM